MSQSTTLMADSLEETGCSVPTFEETGSYAMRYAQLKQTKTQKRSSKKVRQRPPTKKAEIVEDPSLRVNEANAAIVEDQPKQTSSPLDPSVPIAEADLFTPERLEQLEKEKELRRQTKKRMRRMRKQAQNAKQEAGIRHRKALEERRKKKQQYSKYLKENVKVRKKKKKISRTARLETTNMIETKAFTSRKQISQIMPSRERQPVPERIPTPPPLHRRLKNGKENIEPAQEAFFSLRNIGNITNNVREKKESNNIERLSPVQKIESPTLRRRLKNAPTLQTNMKTSPFELGKKLLGEVCTTTLDHPFSPTKTKVAKTAKEVPLVDPAPILTEQDQKTFISEFEWGSKQLRDARAMLREMRHKMRETNKKAENSPKVNVITPSKDINNSQSSIPTLSPNWTSPTAVLQAPASPLKSPNATPPPPGTVSFGNDAKTLPPTRPIFSEFQPVIKKKEEAPKKEERSMLVDSLDLSISRDQFKRMLSSKVDQEKVPGLSHTGQPRAFLSRRQPVQSNMFALRRSKDDLDIILRRRFRNVALANHVKHKLIETKNEYRDLSKRARWGRGRESPRSRQRREASERRRAYQNKISKRQSRRKQQQKIVHPVKSTQQPDNKSVAYLARLRNRWLPRTTGGPISNHRRPPPPVQVVKPIKEETYNGNGHKTTLSLEELRLQQSLQRLDGLLTKEYNSQLTGTSPPAPQYDTRATMHERNEENHRNPQHESPPSPSFSTAPSSVMTAPPCLNIATKYADEQRLRARQGSYQVAMSECPAPSSPRDIDRAKDIYPPHDPWKRLQRKKGKHHETVTVRESKLHLLF